MDKIQECGSGIASAFGGTGNNTNAAAGSLNGNNSVANSNTNYAASFALECYDQKTMIDTIIPDNMVSKTEKIATAMDVENAIVPVSRAAYQAGKEQLCAYEDIPFISEDEGDEQLLSCKSNSVENGEVKHLLKGIKTKSKHKRLRNIKAFLLNKKIIEYAIYEAEKNKVKTKQLMYIMEHIKETVDKIYNELKDETYEPQPFRFKTICNRDDKPRHLAILGFYDRCIQQLLKIVIQDKLRALEPRNVYSNLLERGTLSNNSTYCLYAQLRHDFKIYGKGYGLRMDIHHCYESISVDVIERELFKYITDAFVRRLICRMFKHIKYLPIGDPLSGLYVNLVLREWHRYVLDNRHDLFDKCYFFCDDMLFINKDSKKELHQLCHEALEWIPEHIGVYIKSNYKVFRLSEGVTFCGVRVFPDRLLVKRKIKQRMLKNKNNKKSLISYKGILDKTSSAHFSYILQIHKINDKNQDSNE